MTAFAGRYVFVGGLHRSGTSLVARILAAHPEIAAIAGAPIPEQEGVYLQGAIPHTARHGIPGAFARDPAQHLVEGCAYDRLEVRERILRDWDRWYPPGGRWRVEKSPVNLLRSRLYQQLFPLSHFVFVVRHPAAVAQATAKWSDRAPADLVAHWEHAHGLALSDADFLHHLLILRYEDLCAAPETETARLFAFLGLGRAGALPAVRQGNREYPGLPGLPPGPVARRLGYGADPRAVVATPEARLCRHPLREIRERVAHHGADDHAADAGTAPALAD